MYVIAMLNEPYEAVLASKYRESDRPASGGIDIYPRDPKSRVPSPVLFGEKCLSPCRRVDILLTQSPRKGALDSVTRVNFAYVPVSLHIITYIHTYTARSSTCVALGIDITFAILSTPLPRSVVPSLPTRPRTLLEAPCHGAPRSKNTRTRRPETARTTVSAGRAEPIFRNIENQWELRRRRWNCR